MQDTAEGETGRSVQKIDGPLNGLMFIDSSRYRSRIEALSHSCARRNRSALNITETELKLIAAAAMIGESSRPKKG